MEDPMTDRDDFLDALRVDARQLRFEPDDVMASRLAARVAARIAEPNGGVASILARWLRPMAASFATLLIVATLGVRWFEQSREPAAIEALLNNSSVEVTVDGDTYTLAQ
jgi:glycine/D-amino acid oxidase-like deaminating enzyme